MEIRIKDEFIKLGQALKLAGVVEDGVEAKYAINDGLVLVNGEVENRRNRRRGPDFVKNSREAGVFRVFRVG